MSVEVRVPELGESITEAVVVRWLKDDGAAVRAEEPLLELETDKSALEVVAPFLSEESLMNEACAASVKIAKESWEANKALAKLTMMKVVQVSKNDGQKKTAKEVLDKIAQKEKEQEKKPV